MGNPFFQGKSLLWEMPFQFSGERGLGFIQDATLKTETWVQSIGWVLIGDELVGKRGINRTKELQKGTTKIKNTNGAGRDGKIQIHIDHNYQKKQNI